MLMLGWKLRDFAVWLAYLVMLACTVPWHEPWNDEAQAWLLARDLSLPQLLLHGLRYESHPPLWYLILWIPAHLHLGYFVFCWISAVIAAAGIYVLLRLSPFPFYLRAVLPFTFYLGYQYAVVARGYVLFPLLGFLVAYAYRQTKPRPVLMAVLLALLANVSAHGALVACCFAALYGWKHLRLRRTDEVATRGFVPATIIFLSSLALIALIVAPPRDLITVATPTVTRVLLHQSGTDQAVTTPAAVATPAPPSPQSQQGGLRYRLAELPKLLTYSISSSHLLGFLFYILLIAFLYRIHQLPMLLPLAVIILFLSFVYGLAWHFGMIWITILMILWAVWNPDADTTSGFNLQKVLGGFLLFLSLLQLPWTWGAIRFDIHSPYSGAKNTAAYLRTLPPGLRIAGFGPQSTAVVPYFPENIFFNQPTTFWLWSTRNTIDADAPDTLATHPDLVIVFQQYSFSGVPNYNPVLNVVQADGYREIHRFCGQSYFPKPQDMSESCYLILQPAAALTN
jgi:hypothetical protein